MRPGRNHSKFSDASQNPFSSLVHLSQIAHHSANRRAFGASSTPSVSIVSVDVPVSPYISTPPSLPHGEKNEQHAPIPRRTAAWYSLPE